MNPEIKEQWIAALKSGEYQQGRGVLRTNNTYCCLGVLCDLYAKATETPWQTYAAGVISAGYIETFNSDGVEAPCTGMPGTKVRKWAGVVDFQGNIFSKFYELPVMNDSQGASFTDIANFIAVNL